MDIQVSERRRIENNITQEYFILNLNNMSNYKDSNPINLIIINTSNIFNDIFLEVILNGGMKENVKKIITLDLVILRYIEKIIGVFGKLFPQCDTIQINSFDNIYTDISNIIDRLKIIKNIEYNLDEHIFINYEFKNEYMYFIGAVLTGFLINIKNIIIRNKTNINDFNNFITEKIIQENIVEKHNEYSLNFIKNNGFENICLFNNQIISNKYTNLIKFIFIDFYGNIIINDTLINLNQKEFFEKCSLM